MKSLKWSKLGLIFDPKEHNTPEWMNEFAQAPHVTFLENSIRVYFSCRPLPDANFQYVSYSGYVELDDNFKILEISEQPILELGQLGSFDEFGTYPVSTIMNSKDEMFLYYAGWSRCESVPFNTAIGFARSKDGGKTFQKDGPGPILSYSLNEPFILSGPKIRKFNDKWYLFYIAGREWIFDSGKPEPIYKIRCATSDDGINFKKMDKDLIASNHIHEAQASPDVFYKNGIYHMFYCYRGGKNYRGKENGYRIGYASSKDLVNWERNDSKVGIDISEEGWDSEMISYPHVFEINNQIYMFYLGNNVGKQGFGLAKLEGELI